MPVLKTSGVGPDDSIQRRLWDLHLNPCKSEEVEIQSDPKTLQHLIDALTPFRIVFYIFGFDVLCLNPETAPHASNKKRLNVLFLTVVHTFLLFPIIVLTFVLRLDVLLKYYLWIGVDHGAVVVGVSFTLISSVISYFHTLRNRIRIQKFLLRCLADIGRSGESDEIRRLARKIRRWCLAMAVAVVCLFGSGLAISLLSHSGLMSEGAASHVNIYGDEDHGHDHQHSPITNQTSQWCPNCLVHHLMGLPALQFVPLLVDYFTYCYLLPLLACNYCLHLLYSLLLSTDFEQLESLFAVEGRLHPGVSPSCHLDRSLVAFQRLHRHRCDTLTSLNSFHSSMIFQWVVFEMISLTFVLRRLAQLKADENAVEFAGATVFVVYLTALLFLKYVLTAEVNNKVFDTLYSIRAIDSFDDICTQSQPATVVQNKFQMYTTRLSLSPPALTAWGFFTINKGFLVSVVGTLLTYSLVLRELST